MASVGLSVLEASVGLLVEKGRDWVAKKLAEGDVTNDAFRKLIVRESDEINRKLDGLARKDLNTSLHYFNSGAVYLFQLIRDQDGSATTKAYQQSPEAAMNELKNRRFILRNYSDKRKFAKAKEHFEDACKKATDAFNDEALNTSDRIQAIAICIAATILKLLDDPLEALEECLKYLEELHSMPAVQKNFEVVLRGGFKSKLNRTKRLKIISSVCNVNHFVNDVKCVQTVNQGIKIPLVTIGRGESIDPLNDPRVRTELQGRQLHVSNKKDHNQNDAQEIKTNTDGEVRHTSISESDVIHVQVATDNNFIWVKLEKEKGSTKYVQRTYHWRKQTLL